MKKRRPPWSRKYSRYLIDVPENQMKQLYCQNWGIGRKLSILSQARVSCVFFRSSWPFFILHTDVLPETKNITFQKFNWNLHISFPQLLIAVVVLVNFNLGELLTPICHLQSYLKKKKKKKSLKINFM